ncbi:MAG: SDR family oxidoreductase [Gemmatimonadales bacterium]|nr:MAG: SDR family oxidoreductase [Gemmatimonadales bacterium]
MRTTSGADRVGGKGALEGSTALVTGASRGIGAAVVRALAAEGARVGVVARSREPLQELAEEVGGWALPGDVTDPSDVASVLDGFRERTGGVPDLVVASAGVFTLAPVEETGLTDWALNLDVNLKGSFLLLREVLPAMRLRGTGTLVQVGSIAGRRAFPGNGAYSASKFGLRGLHEVLVEELRGTGVRATLLEPAATDTSAWDPLDPDGRTDLPSRSAMLRPEDVAEAVVFVATRPAGVQIPFLPVERN